MEHRYSGAEEGFDPTLASGSEVEAARLHVTLPIIDPAHELPSGEKSRVDALRDRGVALISDWREKAKGLTQRAGVKTAEWRRHAGIRSAELRDRARAQGATTNRKVHENAAMLAAIATGAGFVLGLVGRRMRHQRAKAKKQRLTPMLVVASEC